MRRKIRLDCKHIKLTEQPPKPSLLKRQVRPSGSIPIGLVTSAMPSSLSIASSHHSRSSPFQSAQPRQDEASSSQSIGCSPSPQVSLSSPTTDLHPQPISSRPPPPTAENASLSASSSLSPSLSPSASPPRPNKYQGPPSTWRNWTAPERDIAASLDKIRAADLSIHLYNAFALKRRAGKRHFGRRPINSNNGKVGDESGTDWAPPRIWTAWPMRVDEVPREGETSKWEDSSTFQRPAPSRVARPGDAVRELLVARVLKKAKERFEAREWEDAALAEDVEESSREDQRKSRSRSKHRKRAPQSRNRGSISLGDYDLTDNKKPLKPVMLADDDLATSLLRPSVQHILSKLDALLLGLHQARAAYASTKPRKQSQPPDSSPDQAERTPAHPGERKQTRSSMRSPRPTDRSLDTDSDSGIESNYSTTAPSIPRSRHRRRRGRQNPDPHASSSAISPFPSSPDAMSISPHPSPTHPSSPPSRTTSNHRRRPKYPRKSYKSTFAPRDWSDILGMASLTGWDPTIVERAAERCAELFGEGMAFRQFDARKEAGEGGILRILRPGGKRGGDGVGRGGDELEEEEEEGKGTMYGGVHIDGFLQPIQGKRWWGRGKDGRIASASRVRGRSGKRARDVVDDRYVRDKEDVSGDANSDDDMHGGGNDEDDDVGVGSDDSRDGNENGIIPDDDENESEDEADEEEDEDVDVRGLADEEEELGGRVQRSDTDNDSPDNGDADAEMDGAVDEQREESMEL